MDQRAHRNSNNKSQNGENASSANAFWSDGLVLKIHSFAPECIQESILHPLWILPGAEDSFSTGISE